MNLIMDPAPQGYFFPLFISELAEGAPIPPAGPSELSLTELESVTFWDMNVEL